MLFEGGVGFCPWHKRDSSFNEIKYTRYVSPTYYEVRMSSRGVIDDSPDHDLRVGLAILECLHCHQTVVLLEHEMRVPRGVGEDDESKVWRSMVYPAQSPRSLHASAPEGVRNLFAEASKCEKAGAMRGAAVLYRAAVEELVKNQGATGFNLYDKIDSLKGALADDLITDLHEARMLGNDSIHSGITYSAEEVADVAQLIEEAVLVLFVQPEEKLAMRAARKVRREAAAAAVEADKKAKQQREPSAPASRRSDKTPWQAVEDPKSVGT